MPASTDILAKRAQAPGRVIVAVVFALLLAACDFLPRYYVVPRDIPPPLVVGPEADGKKLALARTQQLYVALPDDTSGYQWRVDLDNDLSLFPSGAAPKILAATGTSASGTTEFRFRGDGRGTTKVRLSYVPNDNMLAQPSKVVSFEVETQ
jgi:predicted secreted protein